MLRPALLSAIVASSLALAASGQAQQDPLLGRWEGTVEAAQGKRPAVLTLQKDAAGTYTGTITGLLRELPLKEIKVSGDSFTAEAVSPQGDAKTKYSFVLQGADLKGKSETDFGGQTFAASYEFKRAGPPPPEHLRRRRAPRKRRGDSRLRNRRRSSRSHTSPGAGAFAGPGARAP